MKPTDFPESNKLLLKPKDMTDEECASLPVWTDGEMCVSLWRPSLRERLSLLLFGKCWLFALSGGTQPPVAMMIAKDIFEKA